jgi:hypothetical protein
VPSIVTHSFEAQSLAHAQAVPGLDAWVPSHKRPVVADPPAPESLDDTDEVAKMLSSVSPLAQRGNAYRDFDMACACFAALTSRSAQASKRV